MFRYPLIFTIFAVFAVVIRFLFFSQPTIGQSQPKLIKAKDGSGVIGYKDTAILPWCGTSGTTTPAGRAILPC